jgi:cephalosporin hydroxylase
MFMTDSFNIRNKKFIEKMSHDESLKKLSTKWFIDANRYEYGKHFSWLGRPIIQFPHDILAFQEIIWKIKPDLIIETGIARGGSLIFLSSMLELIGKGIVLGIEIGLRRHNENAIKKHLMFKRIKILKGSSTDPKIFHKTKQIAKNKKKILVILDSEHTKNHVLEELNLYSQLVSKGSYIIVCDTIIHDFPKNWFYNHGIDRPWNKANNPKTAVWEFLKQNNRFKIDKLIENKLLVTTSPDGFLKCIKN